MPKDYTSNLNESQLEAVTTTSQYARIIAGAGSGKTRVLTYRIAYLIEEFGIDPSHILAVTFTNKAAREMKARVESLLPGRSQYLTVCTFHAFCASFLRSHAKVIDYPSSYTILDEEDVEKMVKDIAVEKGYKKGDPIVKRALHYIDYHKTYGRYPDDIAVGPSASEEEKICHGFYLAYEERKQAMLCLDFDDLMLKTIYILENSPEARERTRRKYQHILIDEYQDTNDVQYRLLKLLVCSESSIYVVGDPDQTIYTWRGANQGIILNFPRDFDPCEDIVLDRNYRSTKTILAAANKLIANNKKRVPKNLYTEEENGEAILVKRFDSAEEEAKFVIKKINEIASSKWPVDYRDIAILYRASYLTRPFEAELAAKGIPYRLFGGLRFYQRMEVKDALAYFRLFDNPLDDVAFERIVNAPKRGVGDKSVAILREEAKLVGLSELQYCDHLQEHPETELSKKVVAALMLLSSQMTAAKKELEENLETYGSILKRFLTDIGYYAYITSEDDDVDENRVDNVNSLFDDINRYISENPDSTFSEYLQNVSLLTAQDDMNNGNYVSLMTIHVAKGLEFENVFIIGMNDGAFPSYRSVEEKGKDGLEEERRLAYVAMTRAKKTLTMTTNSGYTFTTDSHATPSQFFVEAGLELPKTNTWRSFWDKPKNDSGYYKHESFGDDFFNEPKKPEPPRKTNGITDWRVGDRCHHDKFGDGTIVQIIDSSMVVIAFDQSGKKTLVSDHPMLKRLPRSGAEA